MNEDISNTFRRGSQHQLAARESAFIKSLKQKMKLRNNIKIKKNLGGMGKALKMNKKIDKASDKVLLEQKVNDVEIFNVGQEL